MTEFGETVLFQDEKVEVTTLRFIIKNRETWRLSDFVSAEAGHHTPRVADWMGFLMAAGAGMALWSGISALLGIPSFPDADEFDPATSVLPQGPPEYSWSFVLAGIGLAVAGGVLALAANAIWGKSIVRVETRSDESKIIYESRNRERSQMIVRAINVAIRRKAEETPVVPAGAAGS